MPLTILDPNTALIGETGSTQEIISLLETRSSAS